jgi:hypothetical protein
LSSASLLSVSCSEEGGATPPLTDAPAFNDAPPLTDAPPFINAPRLADAGAQAEDKEALLRKEARDARAKAAELSDKARALRALAQKGVNHVLENELPPSGAADSDA